MPELPEVETVVRDLRPHLTGCAFTRVWAGRRKLRKPWKKIWNRQLVGQRVLSVERRGKWIVIHIENDAVLLVHLGMTGQFCVLPAEAPMQAHTHLVFDLADGRQQLRFRDIRRFGSATLLRPRSSLASYFAESGLGPEPFDVDRDYFRKRLSGTARCLKAVLLDQRLVAGVGNIYADEALFAARLYPGLRGLDLDRNAVDGLRRAVRVVLKRAIERRGSSIRDYVGGSGLRGEYQNEFRVYGRTGEPCPRCRTPIARMVLAGRSTHYCPRCQAKNVNPRVSARRRAPALITEA